MHQVLQEKAYTLQGQILLLYEQLVSFYGTGRIGVKVASFVSVSG